MSKQFEFKLSGELIIEGDDQLDAWENLADHLKDLIEQSEEADFTLGSPLFDMFQAVELQSQQNVSQVSKP